MLSAVQLQAILSLLQIFWRTLVKSLDSFYINNDIIGQPLVSLLLWEINVIVTDQNASCYGAIMTLYLLFVDMKLLSSACINPIVQI